MELTGHIPFRWVKGMIKWYHTLWYSIIQYHTYTISICICTVSYSMIHYHTIWYIMIQYHTYTICIYTIWYSIIHYDAVWYIYNIYMYMHCVIQYLYVYTKYHTKYHTVSYCIILCMHLILPLIYPFPKCCPMNKIIPKKCALYIIL